MLIGTGRHSRVSFNSRTFIGLLRATNFHVQWAGWPGVCQQLCKRQKDCICSRPWGHTCGGSIHPCFASNELSVASVAELCFQEPVLGVLWGLRRRLGFVVNDSPHARKFRRESQKTEGTPEFIQSDGIGAEGLLG